jgi:predicted dehydrogenase
MCFTLRQADAMIAAANRSRVVLMVANNKRYDPAYEYAKPLVTAIRDLRLVRITTLEAPLLPYVKHHRLIRPPDVPADTLAALRAEHETLVREAMGDTAPDDVRALYADVLLDSLVHEVNAVRGLLGDPLEVTSAENWRGSEGVTTVLRFPGDVRCVMTWVNLPTLRRYSQEFAFYGPSDRLALRFPSPFLRNEPTALVLEGMEDGANWEKTLTVSYQESFKRELEHFYDCVVDGKIPYTTGQEARQDMVVLQAIARAAMTRAPQALPSGRS